MNRKILLGVLAGICIIGIFTGVFVAFLSSQTSKEITPVPKTSTPTVASSNNVNSYAETVNYEIVRTHPGEGYKTFYIYVPNSSNEYLIKVAKDVKGKYSSSLPVGLFIWFLNDRSKTEQKDTFGAYALTKGLGVSKLTVFDRKTNTETVVADNL